MPVHHLYHRSRPNGSVLSIKSAGATIFSDQSLCEIMELEADFFELLEAYKDCAHLSSALQSAGDAYQPAEQHVNNARLPMPDEEQEHVVISNTLYFLLNHTCPLRGKLVIELSDPFHSPRGLSQVLMWAEVSGKTTHSSSQPQNQKGGGGGGGGKKKKDKNQGEKSTSIPDGQDAPPEAANSVGDDIEFLKLADMPDNNYLVTKSTDSNMFEVHDVVTRLTYVVRPRTDIKRCQIIASDGGDWLLFGRVDEFLYVSVSTGEVMYLPQLPSDGLETEVVGDFLKGTKPKITAIMWVSTENSQDKVYLAVCKADGTKNLVWKTFVVTCKKHNAAESYKITSLHLTEDWTAIVMGSDWRAICCDLDGKIKWTQEKDETIPMHDASTEPLCIYASNGTCCQLAFDMETGAINWVVVNTTTGVADMKDSVKLNKMLAGKEALLVQAAGKLLTSTQAPVKKRDKGKKKQQLETLTLYVAGNFFNMEWALIVVNLKDGCIEKRETNKRCRYLLEGETKCSCSSTWMRKFGM